MVREHNPFRSMASRWRTAIALRAVNRLPANFDERMAFDNARGLSDAALRAELSKSESHIAEWDAVIRARGNTPIGAPLEADRVAA